MKNNQSLKKLFISELADMQSAENQIIEALPKLIKLANTKELKDALLKHLEETKNQALRIQEIFEILGENPGEKLCKAAQGLIKEADDIVKDFSKSYLLDAAIISACQKVEHYEIASYGTLRSFAKQLDLDSQIIDLLKETLDEEAGADKALSKIAEGTMFTTGINEEAIAHSVKH